MIFKSKTNLKQEKTEIRKMLGVEMLLNFHQTNYVIKMYEWSKYVFPWF